MLKDLKELTKQRFGAIDFTYPPAPIEANRGARGCIDRALDDTLVAIGQRSRNLRGHGLDEGVSTRMLIQAGRPPRRHRAGGRLPGGAAPADHR